MNKLYFVAYNPTANFNYFGFHKQITQVMYPKIITDWWHHISHGYIIVSSQPVNNLYNLLYPSIPGQHFMIIEIEPNNAQGWLPKGAWGWINKYRK
ncbi:MAG: hypothetical protein ACRCZE_00660 [Candidatus Altimarinota bacterium]